MNKKAAILITMIAVFLSGCCIPSSDLVSRDIGKDTTKIMVVIEYEPNPNGINEAKMIIDKDEIAKIVDSFRCAKVGEEIDSIYGSASVFRFYKDDELLLSLSFSHGRSRSHALNRDNNCYTVVFKGDSPWTLYTESAADVCHVNIDFQIIP